MILLYISNQRLPTEKAYGIQIAKTCEALANYGIDVKLTVPHRVSDIAENFFDYYAVKRNFKFNEVFSLDLYLPGRLDGIAFLLKNFISALVIIVRTSFLGVDIVYSRDELIIYLLSILKKPRKLVFEAHRFSNSRQLFYRRFKKNNIKVITISHGLRNKFVEFGFKSENLLVAPDGVDIDNFNINETMEECRRKLNLPIDKKIIMYSGHLFDWKGVHALATASTHLPEALFVFVGGTDEDAFKFKKQYYDKENIIILGHKPHSEIPLFLRAADVLVLPNSAKEGISVSYTSPLKLFEYMASRRPIVASDLPSIREILNENNSILVKPDDVDALANGIDLALNDSVLTERISEAAYESVKKYTWYQRSRMIIDFLTK